jgi:hypothetical protein
LIPYFAITLFAGVRPGPNGELAKLAEHPELVSLENRSIRITAAISTPTVTPITSPAVEELVQDRSFPQKAAKPSESAQLCVTDSLINVDPPKLSIIAF